MSVRTNGELSRFSGTWLIAAIVGFTASACAPAVEQPTADLVLRNGRVYTLTWGEPDDEGGPAEDAPYGSGGWQPDASAIAIEGGALLYVGNDEGIDRYVGERTRVVDLHGATVLPGLVDAHTHVFNLGATLEQVDLVGVETEEEAVERVARRAASVRPGTWIIGYGWDEGAWADRYPSKELLSERLPDHPILMRGLHSFAAWGNQQALDRAGITSATEAPSGGRVVRNAAGEPTGLLMDRATALLEDAILPPTREELEERFLLGARAMTASGFTTVHEAGLDAEHLQAVERLAAEGRLPVRVYAMLSARDTELLRQWVEWGPDTDGNDNLVTRSVKAFYDGVLGSRGARLIEEYSDQPGHYGVSGSEYGFDEELVAEAMAAGFQVGIHAIGDAGNRETLDFLERALTRYPEAREQRHRVEHAQVVHPADFWRFRVLGITASVQPPHAMEDKTWAEDRLGSERLEGAYAWRTFRRLGVPLVFSSDLPGSDHDIFYGLHSAITRRDKDLMPALGWHPAQRMTPEEAIRGYTTWAARSAFLEGSAGTLVPGLWADITVMDIDPLVVGENNRDRLLEGRILMTIVGGRVVYEAGR